MTFAILALLLRVILFVIATGLLIWFRDVFNRGQRCGLGLVGGSSILTLAVIADFHKTGTPFDDWGGALLSLGMILFFGFTMQRYYGHMINNKRAVRDAERWKAQRGK